LRDGSPFSAIVDGSRGRGLNTGCGYGANARAGSPRRCVPAGALGFSAEPSHSPSEAAIAQPGGPFYGFLR
jgi:hypothetical protein